MRSLLENEGTIILDDIVMVSPTPAATPAPDVTAAATAAAEGTPVTVSPSPDGPLPAPGVSPWFLVGAGIVIVLLAAACVILWLRGRRMSAPASALAPSSVPSNAIGGIAVGKLHAQGARSGQQDSFGVSEAELADPLGTLAVVADGMGGLSDGDKVSAAAVEAVLDGFLEPGSLRDTRYLMPELARRAVAAVNGLLGPDDYRKSGTTLLIGLIREGMFSFVSIGDSRICLLRGGELIQLNREHIYLHDRLLQAVNGECSLREALGDDRTSSLTSFVGMGTVAAMDIPAAPLKLLSGDKIILMSDGVYNALDKAELTALLAGGAEEAASAIGQAVAAKGYSNQDNYTAVILSCLPADAGETK